MILYLWSYMIYLFMILYDLLLLSSSLASLEGVEFRTEGLIAGSPKVELISVPARGGWDGRVPPCRRLETIYGPLQTKPFYDSIWLNLIFSWKESHYVLWPLEVRCFYSLNFSNMVWRTHTAKSGRILIIILILFNILWSTF